MLLPSEVADWVQAHPVLAIVAGIVALALTLGVALLARVATRRVRSAPASTLTVVAAAIATAVSASGMWQFFERVMPGLAWPWRVLMFAFLEVAVVTSAVRARESMHEHGSAGIDGIAVWVLTSLSAALSAMEATSLPEGIFRLAAPLVAAWLWERGMSVEHRRLTGRARIHWRVTPERILIWLGLAEARDRTAPEVDAHRRLNQVARAALRVRGARPGSLRRRIAVWVLTRRTARAVEHANLASPGGSAALLRLIGALYGATRLAEISPMAPWDVQVTPVRGSGGDPGSDPDPDPAPDPGPGQGRRSQLVLPPPGLDVTVALPALPSDADKIRMALTVLGLDATPRQVLDWLASAGVQVRQENVKSVLRRERARAREETAAVVPLRPAQ